MKKIYLIFAISLLMAISSFAQVSINSDGTPPANSAMLEVKSTTKGLLPPRMTSAQRDAIVAPDAGLMIFNTDCNDINLFDGAAWIMVTKPGSLWISGDITGNDTPCLNATGEVYSVNDVPEALTYTWTVPPGASITAGQGTTSITVNFGTTDGAITVMVYNKCYKSSTVSMNISLGFLEAPVVSSIALSQTVIVWNFNPVNKATGYKWNIVNNYNTATDIGADTSVTETGLNCNTTYTRYFWAYTSCTSSLVAISTQTTLGVPEAPIVSSTALCQTVIGWKFDPVNQATGYKWNTENNYNTATDMGTDTSLIETGLTCNTMYTRFFWAYNNCTSSIVATSVQTTTTCLPQCSGVPFVLYGGQYYDAVQISTQCWFARNLNIGTRIWNIYNQSDNSIIEKFCYENMESNCDVYGGLYQWDETMQYATTQGVQGICPSGWHIPTDAEFTTLTNNLGGESVAGGKMKEVGTAHWNPPNTDATNSSSFTALPNGYSYSHSYWYLQSNGYLWTSTLSTGTAWMRYLWAYAGSIQRYDVDKTNGYAVRCLKN